MSGSPTSPTSGSSRPTSNGPAEDPLAADKRTLIIALIAMVGLMSVGIVSAAIFTGSACQDIGPSPVTPAGAWAEVDDALSIAFPDATPEVVAAVGAQLGELGEQLGTITGVAVVDGADGLVATSDGVAATGPVTSLLSASGDVITASVDVGAGVVVGSGDALVSLARVNDLTGQVDAFAGIDATANGGLTEIGCVDTATVGTPLAFELDAADGGLLLFRADEDGDDAEVELRDPREGRLWSTRVDVGMAPPGVTGERIDARLGDELAVLVRRTAPGEDTPVVTAVDRADGSLRWQVGREALRMVPVPSGSWPDDPDGGPGASVVRDDAAQRLEVLALDADQVVLALTDARDEDAVVAGGTEALGPSTGPGHVVALDAHDGTPRWQRPLGSGVRVLAAAGTSSSVWLVVEDDGQAELVGFDTVGDPHGQASAGAAIAIDAPSPSAAITALPTAEDTGPEKSGIVAVLGEQLVVVRSDGDGVTVEVIDTTPALPARDVLAIVDRVHVLFGWPPADGGDGTGAPVGSATRDRAVLVTFDIGG